jgi:16S rRNA (uracil1498-N3)-methyltransferase
VSVHRFHVPGVAQGRIDLPEAGRNHATRVLRLEVGDPIRVFDAGSEFDATLREIAKNRVTIDVGSPVESLPERSIPMRLIVSPLKGDLTELVIQQATQLGVARISLAIFERTDTVARRDPGESRMERWRRVASSAAEQCGRAAVPPIDAVRDLPDLLASLDAVESDLRIVAAEPSIALRESRPAPALVRAVTIAVGPAGGLAPADLESLDRSGFRPERFAAHTLRSETAAAAAVAILGDRYR